MLKRIIFASIFVTVCSLSVSAQIRVSDQYFNKYTIQGFACKDSTILLSCNNSISFSNSDPNSFYRFKNGIWELLPRTDKLTGLEDSLYSTWSTMEIVNNNEFWAVNGRDNRDYLNHFVDNKWEKVRFNDTVGRRWIEELRLDAKGNLWIFSVYTLDSKDKGRSEIHLVKNNKLELIYSTEGWSVFFRSDCYKQISTALPEGGISFFVKTSWDEHTQNVDKTNDFMTLSPDGKLDKMELMPRNNYNAIKPVTSIYSESKDKFFVGYGYYSIVNAIENYGTDILWYIGLAKYQNGNWTTYDKSSGLPTFRGKPDSIMCPVWDIVKLGSRLFVKTSQGFYYSDDEKQFYKYDISSALSQMTFYKNQSTTLDSIITNRINLELEGYYGDDRADYSRCELNQNGLLILSDGYYMGMTNINTLASANENEQSVSCEVYPNPVKNTVFLKNVEINSSIRIYNSIGNEVLNSSYSESGIDCSKLSNGTYNVYIINGNKITVARFVK